MINSLIPLNEIESGAMSQLKALEELPFVKEIAVMPDIHQGYEMPIGTVALMSDVVSSACVGYDIGCGMSQIILDTTKDDVDMESVKEHILATIPLGFKSHLSMRRIPEEPLPNTHLAQLCQEKAAYQLGTLGGGNHFIEIGESQNNGRLAITIHSGSRNVGHMIATHFNKLNDEGLPKGYFWLGSNLGIYYRKMATYAEKFAHLNRERMVDEILQHLPACDVLHYTNESHNHFQLLEEGHVLHRKGATAAEEGQFGIIPINMRDGVYLTRGLGNEDYLWSASHGAGRVMSRKKAKKELNYEDVAMDMCQVASNLNKSMLDEAPGAYKTAEYVLGPQVGSTIEIIDHFKPLLVVKG